MTDWIEPCIHPDGRHRWVVPVVHARPDTNWRYHSYNIPGQIVKAELVFCRVCGTSAPTGEAEGEV
jgi:hypothetical protein